MKKKISNNDSPQIGPRRNKKKDPISITWRFNSIDEEFTITATPAAWIKLKEKCFGSPDTYRYITKGLFKDLWPFVHTGFIEAQNWTPKEGQQLFRNSLYVQAAIICDLSGVAGKYGHITDLWGKTFDVFKSVWKEDPRFLGLKVIEEKRSSDGR